MAGLSPMRMARAQLASSMLCACPCWKFLLVLLLHVSFHIVFKSFVGFAVYSAFHVCVVIRFPAVC